MSFKSPLSVFILWHPDYSEGQQIADFLYSILCRDFSKPLIRSIGIPVYFRNKIAANGSQPIDIDFNESELTAVIALIDDKFILDPEFKVYLDKISDECEVETFKRRIYPIAISKNANKVSSKISEKNFFGIVESENKNVQIKSPVMHELCRFLMNMKKGTEEEESSTDFSPVKLFISHSKHDESKEDAIAFRDFINSQTQLKTFFDVNDIAYGSNFGEQIKKSARESALVAFQSDTYAEREWCRVEVLEAKKAGCPIVIVNAVQHKEQRAFPYLGNYPSIRFKDKNYLQIVDLTLEQVLFNRYTIKFIDLLTDQYGIRANRILSTSPELFNFIQLKKDGLLEKEELGLVIYPDPPLGTEEMEILNQLDDDYVFITPLSLPSIAHMK